MNEVVMLSYGGGVNSAALAILNSQGQVEPPARVALFADTGAELPETYVHLALMARWLAARGLEVVRVEQVKGTLESYVRNVSTVIPVRGSGMLGRRQCTRIWKVEPIQQWLRAQGVERAMVQLAISLDEAHRMKPSPDAWVTNTFPLVDLGLTRAACRRIVEDAGLPLPPKSACFFCPFHSVAAWQGLAVYHPDLFEQAAQLEEAINARRDYSQRVFLSSRLRPLRQAFSARQLALPLPEPDDLCGGYCFV